MAQNVLEQATHDVGAPAHDPGALAQTIQHHAGTRMYVAEVAALLEQQNKWDAVKKQIRDHDLAKHAENDGKTVNSAVKDADKHGDDKNQIRFDMIGQDPFYGERYLARLHENGKLHNIQNIHDPTFRARAGRSLGMAELDGLIAGGDVVKLGSREDAGQGRTPFDPLTGVAESITESTIDDAKSHLESAQKKLASLDNQLQLQLREIGPSIWDPNETNPARVAAAQQRVKAYIADFKSAGKYKQAVADVNKWSAALHVEVTSHESDLEGQAGDPVSPNAGKHGLDQVINSYKDLAATPGHAFEAVKWAKQHETDPAFAHVKNRVVDIANLGQETDAAAHIQNLAAIMRKSGDGEDGKSAVLEALRLIDERVIKPYDTVERINGLRELKEAVANVRAHIAEFRARNAKSIEQISVSMIRLTSDGDPVVRRVGSSFGMMMTVVEDRNKIAITANFVEIGDNVKELYLSFGRFKATVDKGLHDAKKITAEAEDINGKFAKLARIMGPLAFAADALGVAEDIQELRKDGNPAVAVKLVGDMASTVGSAIALFPPLAPIGDAIGLIGQAISLIASGFIGDTVGNERRGDEREHLQTTHAFAGAPNADKLPEVFTNDDAAGNLQDADKLHLTLDEIRRLGAFHPFLFKDPHMISGADDLRSYLTNGDNMKLWQLSPLKSPYRDTLFGFLRAIHDDDLMKTAIRLKNTHNLGTSDVNQRMVELAQQALPHDAFDVHT